ncbi:MAG: type I-C CRISPR-associated protein Cas5c [Candidatus Competibacteraceae bacterium]|nr:type I-C CRISPR-associated protein Cas5c [Candidatus Competibacteraceae bacterium]
MDHCHVILRVWGENACFTRPEMKVERVSYDVITPSAARGVLEAILWKPAIRWHIHRIDVLKPIRWESVRRNEVASNIPVSNLLSAMKSQRGNLGLFVEDNRQQRAGLVLRDVDYLIHARFELTEKAGPEDNINKFADMFRRRAEKGQCFHQPYLGCREFAAAFACVDPSDQLPVPIAESRGLGWMMYDLDYSGAEIQPLFFRAELDNGSIRVPDWDSEEVKG